MLKLPLIYALLLLPYIKVFAQPAINAQQFFLDDHLIKTELQTDIKSLRKNKEHPVWQAATITMHFSDTFLVKEKIQVQMRGEYRKNNCDIASLMMDFKNITSTKLSSLKKLKLVGGCRSDDINEQLLLKEFVTYKICNFLTPMSFRVRLLQINYNDDRSKVKTYDQFAFLIEDMKDVADRNNCKEIKKRTVFTQQTNRNQMTFVALFQYMIGNTDWAIPVYHNIKLMVPKNDTMAMPFPVPYDFDYAGIVNASYATPDESLNIRNVTERFTAGMRALPKN